MAKNLYVGVGGVARRAKGLYIGVNGVARKVKNAYIGVGGVARCFYSAFPASPSAYNLSGTYTSATTFTAPKDGWYQFELFGAAGNGGDGNAQYGSNGYDITQDSTRHWAHVIHGGSGGGGAYCCSRVALKKGDTAVFQGIAQHSTATITITSNYSSSYSHTMTCVSGGIGGGGNLVNNPGSAGTASGGNYSNVNGNKGNSGKTFGFAIDGTTLDMSQSLWDALHSGGTVWMPSGGTSISTTPTASGSAAVSGGTVGGKSAYYVATYNASAADPITLSIRTRGLGGTAYMKVYAGNTN